MTTNPVTGQPFTTADVDRLLGLADQFLEDWEGFEGQGDPDCVARRKEWDALRPLLVSMLSREQLICENVFQLTWSSLMKGCQDQYADSRDFFDDVYYEAVKFEEEHINHDYDGRDGVPYFEEIENHFLSSRIQGAS